MFVLYGQSILIESFAGLYPFTNSPNSLRFMSHSRTIKTKHFPHRTASANWSQSGSPHRSHRRSEIGKRLLTAGLLLASYQQKWAL